jgi:hypothetical protein
MMFSSAFFQLKLRSCKRMAGLIALVLVTVAANGQKPAHKKNPPYALLMGTVWTADGHPMPGVTVRIRRAEEKKAHWTAISDNRGEFAQRLPAGKQDYVIWADLKGKKGGKPIETTAHIENDERVDVGLHLTE